MAGRCGGVQHLLQGRENRRIAYVHCLNHQLHLVVAHALSAEQPISDFFDVCSNLYKFFRKPTVALHYNGEKLKRLLEQRWAGHLATITAVLNSFQHIISFLREIGISSAHKADVACQKGARSDCG